VSRAPRSRASCWMPSGWPTSSSGPWEVDPALAPISRLGWSPGSMPIKPDALEVFTSKEVAEAAYRHGFLYGYADQRMVKGQKIFPQCRAAHARSRIGERGGTGDGAGHPRESRRHRSAEGGGVEADPRAPRGERGQLVVSRE
jgi:hypothetical protein